MTNDREAGTRTREVAFNGRAGSMNDVIQRTDDGYTRETTGTLPNGEMHTRPVDATCDETAAKCVKQVEVDKQP